MNTDGSPVDSAYARYEEYMDPLLGRRVRRVFMQAPPIDAGDKQVNMKILAYGPGQTSPTGY